MDVSFSQRGSAARTVLTITACLVLLGVFGALTVRYVAIDLPSQIAERTLRGARESAHEIAAQVAAAFQVQPKVVVAHSTVVEQRTEVLQLTTLQQTLTERQRVDDSWLLSTKTLEVEADFVVRVGFDLAKPFVIDIDQSSGALKITLPPAEILSIEVHDVRFLRDENGFWNPLSGDDRERTIRDLKLRVAMRARTGDLLEQARSNAEKRLEKLLARDGRTVTFSPHPISVPIARP